MLHHFATFQYSVDVNVSVPLGKLFVMGYLAVDIFFILSGFVMTHSYRDRLETAADLRRYARARVARLMPLHWLTLAAMIAMVLTAQRFIAMPREQFAWELVPINILNLQGIAATHTNWNYPSWSICFEMIAYIVLPFLIRREVRLPWLLFAGGMLTATLFYVWVQHFHPTDFERTTTGLGALLRSVGLFVAGIALRLLWDRQGVRDAARGPWLYGLVIVWLAGAVLLHWPKAWMVWGMPLALAWLLAARLSLPAPVMSPLKWLGDISFSIYLLHAPVELAFGTVLAWSNGGQAPAFTGIHAAALVALLAGVTLLLGTLSYRYFERPCQAWLRGNRPRPAVPLGAGQT